jgi:hypothetical protein
MADDDNSVLLKALQSQQKADEKPFRILTRDDLLGNAQLEYDHMVATLGGRPIPIVLDPNYETPADLVDDVSFGKSGDTTFMMVGEFSHRWTEELKRSEAPSNLDMVKLAPAEDALQELADARAEQRGIEAPKIYSSANGITNAAWKTKEGNYVVVLKRGQSEEENRAVVLHEIEHIANGDVEFARVAEVHNTQSYEVMRAMETAADKGITAAGFGEDGVKTFKKWQAQDKADAEQNGMVYDQAYQRSGNPAHPFLEQRAAIAEADGLTNQIIGTLPLNVLDGLKGLSGCADMDEPCAPPRGGAKLQSSPDLPPF